MVKSPDNLPDAREALDSIWETASLKGRCWGIRKKGNYSANPYSASNITVANDKGELVSVSQLLDGTLVVHQFVRVIGGTKLGNEVIKALKEADLPVKD